MATPEAKAKAKFRFRLKSVCAMGQMRLWLEGHAGSQFGSQTLDYTGVVLPRGWGRGVPFAVEVKRFDIPAKATPRQEATMRDMRAAGIHAVLVRSDDDVEKFVVWLRALND